MKKETGGNQMAAAGFVVCIVFAARRHQTVSIQ
jgi:hypothetical protein